MFDQYRAEIIEFIRRSMDDLRLGRGERITGSFKFAKIEVYVDIKKEEE